MGYWVEERQTANVSDTLSRQTKDIGDHLNRICSHNEEQIHSELFYETPTMSSTNCTVCSVHKETIGY